MLHFSLSVYAQAPVSPTWTLIEDDFEGGTLADWGKVPASNPAAQPQLIVDEGVAGSTGLRVKVATGESYLYQSDLMPADSGALRFWFHPNRVTIPDQGDWIPSKSFRIADIKGGAALDVIAAIRIRQSGGNYYGFLEWRDPQAGMRYDYAAGEFSISNNLLSHNIGYQLKAQSDALDNLIAEFNLIDDLVGVDAYEITGDFPVFGDPEFFDADSNNFSLLAASAAIDAAGSAHAPDFDYENRFRPLDGDRDGTAAVDVSAYEFDPSLYPFVQIKVMLKGVYDPAGGNMQTGPAYGPLPNQSPYAANPREVQDIPEHAVDWVLVGFTTPSGDMAVKDTTLFLNGDGMIMDEHGNTEVAMTGLTTGLYRLFLQNRNHLAVQSRSLLACEGGEPPVYDFSCGREQYFSPPAGRELAAGVWGMVAGDCNQDVSVTSSDYVEWYNARSFDPVPYAVPDLNLDGKITSRDYAVWLINCRSARTNHQIQ